MECQIKKYDNAEYYGAETESARKSVLVSIRGTLKQYYVEERGGWLSQINCFLNISPYDLKIAWV